MDETPAAIGFVPGLSIARQLLTPDARAAVLADHAAAVYGALDKETLHLLMNRAFDVECPECGEHQAAAHYCYHCLLPLVPTDWYNRRELAAARTRATMSDAVRAAFAQSRARMKERQAAAKAA